MSSFAAHSLVKNNRSAALGGLKVATLSVAFTLRQAAWIAEQALEQRVALAEIVRQTIDDVMEIDEGGQS